MKNLFLILFFTTQTLTLIGQQKANYPEPLAGMKRVDLILPKIENEKNYKVEIRFGMKSKTSECSESNSFSFNINNLKNEYGIKPSRFPYYILPSQIPIDTLEFYNDKNCNKDKIVERKLISDQSIQIEYQSYYSVPFYIPENWTIEYKLWKTDDKYKTLK